MGSRVVRRCIGGVRLSTVGVEGVGRVGLSVLWVRVGWVSESRARFVKNGLLSGHGNQSSFLKFS